MAKKKRKDSPITKVRRFISSKIPENILKRKAYSSRPDVKERRKELNRDRRKLSALTLQALKDGFFYTTEGKQFSIIGNKLVTPEDKSHYFLNNQKEIKKTSYLDDIQLISMGVTEEIHQDTEFLSVLKKLMDGNDEVINLLKKKKTLTEVTDSNMDQLIDYVRKNCKKDVKKILKNFDEEEEDDDSEENDLPEDFNYIK